ncbi:MAG: heparinase II/III family protein [Pseudomonadota bacterium]
MKSIGQIAGARLPRRVTARLAGIGSTPSALVWQPAPPTKGDPAIARQLSRGVLLFDGRLLETMETHPWDLGPPDQVWQDGLHGQAWLDDAAASDDPACWTHLTGWLWTWIERYGQGTGPGWEPEVASRRLTRWIAHSVRILTNQPSERSNQFFRAMGLHVRYVDWRWRETSDGPERIEALAGLVYARLSLEGKTRDTQRAIADLGREAARIIGPDGGIASRSPEDLARIVAMLTWSLRAIEDSGLTPSVRQEAAIRRAEPVLAALRHPSGDLARFHGGKPGVDLAPEHRNQLSQGRPPSEVSAPMGYQRMTCGRTCLIMDGAIPPSGAFGKTAHASAMAFELSVGRDAVVVNSGSGHAFGSRAAQSSRRAAAHSGVELGRRCPGRLLAPDGGAAQLLTDGRVRSRLSYDAAGAWLLGESALYENWFGMLHERRLHLRLDGLRLSGEDTVLANRAETRTQVQRAFEKLDAPAEITVRLHLAPDVVAATALNGRAISLKVPDGGTWMFAADTDNITLADSTYYDENRPKPRATQQIIARAPILDYWGRIIWSLEQLPQGSSPLRLRVADSQ